MSKRSAGPGRPGTSILGRIVRNGRGGMSPTAARQILKIGFSQADQDRMSNLAERNQQGALSPAEKSELMEYVDASHVLSILHSVAQMAMDRTRTAKA